MRKMLFIDIETTPALAYTFSLFKPYIQHTMVKEDPYIMCFSAKWLTDKKSECQFYSVFHDGEEAMFQRLWELLDEADVVVTFNGNKFDIPWIEGELITKGFTPPSPYQRIDLYREYRAHSNFISTKLDYVSQRLLTEHKVQHEGWTLWLKCMEGDPVAWKKMRRYSIRDTVLMPQIYLIIRPWIKNHPNMLLDVGADESYDDVEVGLRLQCPACEEWTVGPRGHAYTNVGRYRRYFCYNCGKWMRDPRAEKTGTLRNIV